MEVLGALFTICYIILIVYGIFKVAFNILNYIYKKITQLFKTEHSPPKISISEPIPKNISEQPKNKKRKEYSVNNLQFQLDKHNNKSYKSNRELGFEYERYVGYLIEQMGYRVVYNGINAGCYDKGRDLLCFHDEDKIALIVQCKRWSIHGNKSYIGEKEIEKLVKTTLEFKNINPEWKIVTPIFYSTVPYTKKALRLAKKFDVDCYIEEFKTIKEYPSIKCVITNNYDYLYYLPFDHGFDQISVNFLL